MRIRSLRHGVVGLLLLAFSAVFSHELFHRHAETSSEPCAICVQWAQQTAVEAQAAILPQAPVGFEVAAAVEPLCPAQLFDVLPRLRGPPAPLLNA